MAYENYIHYNEGGGKKGLSVGAWIAIAIAAVFLISIFSFVGACKDTYNDLVELDVAVDTAFSDVQNVMQARAEKIPDMAKVTEAAADHFETIYKDIADGRKALGACKTPEELDAANAEFVKSINQFLVIAENYPTITASEQYTALLDSIEGAVNRLLIARSDYNVAVGRYNSAVRSFPGILIAKMFGFEERDTFVADEEAGNTSIIDYGK